MNSTNQRLPQWTLDPMHTTVMFTVRHLMITNVQGVFEAVRGTAHYDADRPELTSVEIEIPAASINTRQPQRDAHLKSADFFDAEAHPTISFRSTRIAVVDGRVQEITGALTIRGITREIALAVEEISEEQLDHNGKPRIGAAATAKILRSEFGMTYNRVLEAGRLAVGNEVKLRFDVSLLKEDAPDLAQRSMLRGDAPAQHR